MKKQAILKAYKTADYDTKEMLKKAFPKYFALLETEWLKHFAGSIVFRTGENTGYGVGSSGIWKVFDENTKNQRWSFNTCPQNWQPATEEEVKEMLIAEAKSRGIWDCPIVSVNGLEWVEWHGNYNQEFDFSENQLWSKYGLVFEKGKWATPIEEKSNSTTFEIDGKTYLVTLVE